LTGPVARGDQRTVARHRETVRARAPELLELFDALVGATARLAKENETARNPVAANPVGSAEPAPTSADPI
jgi:predicted short-subunit dehydrogenase-like oxidoreductase (DUF2520 family)